MIISIRNLLIKQSFSLLGKHAFTIFLFITCTASALTAGAQTIVQGKVTDESGKPLTAASIVVKGTSRGVTTDNNGDFKINASKGDVLVLSSVGFTDKQVKLAGENNISVSLTSNNSTLEQVIVVGYGTQKRTNVTGAISTVSGKTITELPVPNIQQALQGRVPGLTVTNNGTPGGDVIVRIRGISSISFASNPLYVVDGYPTGDIATFDTRDIETVDVLKDASAAAIYGSRASNGVIIMTTKKGTRDRKLHVSLNSNYGIQNINQRFDLLSPQQFDQYALAYRGSLVARRDPSNPDKWINRPIFPGASTTYGNNVTNWQDEYFRTGNMTQTNIGLSGGNEMSRFYASGGFFNQEGTTPSVGYRRYNFRINSDHKISKVFSFGENLFMASARRNFDNNEQGSRSNLINVVKMMPYMPVHDPTTNGGYRGVNSVLDGGDPTNPLEDAELKNPGTSTALKILGTAFVQVDFTKWLSFRSTFGIDHANTLSYRFSPIFNDSGSVAGSSAVQATVFNNRFISTQQLYTQQLTFDNTFGDHHLNVIAVNEYQAQRTKVENASGSQASNILRQLHNATNVSVDQTIGENNLTSFLGRMTYEYKGKYLLNAAVRRDGLSVWAPGKKWATFPSASVGWRIDQENFMKSITKISELKFRAGYGITGLDGRVLGNTPWLVNVDALSASYPFGNALSQNASSINSLGNKDLEWEKTKQLNFGIDLGLFNNSFTLSGEYYHRQSDNLILSVPLPPSLGYINSSVNKNIGSMQNNGFELQAGYNKRKGEFQWNVGANMSIVRNKVLKLAEGVSNIESGSDVDATEGYNVSNTVPGYAVQSFYGWVVEGIFQSQDEVSKHAKQVVPTTPGGPGTSAGDIKFKDVNGDGKIDVNDRIFLGSYIPKMSYAFNLGGSYKNFNLSVFFQGVSGNKIYNGTRTVLEGMVRFFNAGTKVLNAWTPTNTNTDVPRAISSDPNQNARPSTRFLEDGSYLRLKNIQLSYNIPVKSLQSLTGGAISSFNIYVSAQNLATITKYTGLDPEVGNRTPGSSLTNGVDYAVYPQPKSYQVGINVNF
jgi:TonB-linked SusC/RagA family outer membrane protein